MMFGFNKRTLRPTRKVVLPRRKTTIAELETILNHEEDSRFEILPNGEIRQLSSSDIKALGPKIPLTFRENLGGEYAYGSVG